MDKSLEEIIGYEQFHLTHCLIERFKQDEVVSFQYNWMRSQDNKVFNLEVNYIADIDQKTNKVIGGFAYLIAPKDEDEYKIYNRNYGLLTIKSQENIAFDHNLWKEVNKWLYNVVHINYQLMLAIIDSVYKYAVLNGEFNADKSHLLISNAIKAVEVPFVILNHYHLKNDRGYLGYKSEFNLKRYSLDYQAYESQNIHLYN